MPVLSVALITRGGRPCVARQFVELPKLRVEAMLASFPKLLSPAKQSSTTFVESDTVRYVFQPMEQLHLVLITTKNSNIVEDLDTLRLLSKVVADICPVVTEETISEAAFELINAFDEVVSLGYREAITLAGIRVNLEMNSHEEKLSQMIRQSKEIEAKQEMKRAAASIRQKKQDESRSGPTGGMGGGGSSGGKMQGFGSSSTYVPSSTGANGGGPYPGTNATPSSTSAPAKVESKPAVKKGIQLGKKQKDVFEAVAQEDGIDTDMLMLQGGKAGASSVAAPGSVAVQKDPFHVQIQETVTASIKQDGSLVSYAVSGQVSLITRQEDLKFIVKLAPPSNQFQFKPHPQLDKAAWDKASIIQLKQADRSLPTNTAFGALRYRSNKVEDTSAIPLSLTVWPEQGKGGITNVNLEYELHGDDLELLNVIISVPLGSNEAPDVQQASVGSHRINSRKQQLEWVIDSITSANATGSLEFNVSKSDPTSFFPTTIAFSASESLAGVKVLSVVNAQDTTQEIRFGQETTVETDGYEVTGDE